MAKKTQTEMDLQEFLSTYKMVRSHKPKDADDRKTVMRILDSYHSCDHFEKDGKAWRISHGQCPECKAFSPLEKEATGPHFCPECIDDKPIVLNYPALWWPMLSNKERSFIWDKVKGGSAELKMPSLATASYDELVGIEEMAKRLGEHAGFLKLTEEWREEDEPEEEKKNDAGPDSNSTDAETTGPRPVPTEG